MITVLNINNAKTPGLLDYVSGIWKKGEVRAEIRSGGGVKVMYLDCGLRAGKPDWEKISEYSGSARGCILCNRSVLLPRNLGFKRFYSRSLYRLMSINGAVSVLSLLKTDCRRISLCFCDEYGEYSGYAPLFLPLCGSMKILSRSAAYSSFADYAMGEYGACVKLCKSAAEASDCNVFVAPRFADLELYSGKGAFMFNGGAARSANYRVKTINGYLWPLPAKYRALKPPCISGEYFSQALYSIARCKDNARAAPHTFYCNGAALSAAAVAADIISPGLSALDTGRAKVYNKL